MKEHEENEAPIEEVAEELDFEPEDELGSIGAVKAKMQKLRAELDKAKAERQEYLDGWQRCKADSMNAKKEAAALYERQQAQTRESLIEDMLPVLDSFDMATGSPIWESVNPEWRSGMERIRQQLLDILSKHGIKRFGSIGDAYDPHIHDAVQEVHDVPGEPGSIVRVLRYGYKTKERILRPSQVIIKSHT